MYKKVVLKGSHQSMQEELWLKLAGLQEVYNALLRKIDQITKNGKNNNESKRPD